MSAIPVGIGKPLDRVRRENIEGSGFLFGGEPFCHASLLNIAVKPSAGLRIYPEGGVRHMQIGAKRNLQLQLTDRLLHIGG
jgi:hypothetical protein